MEAEAECTVQYSWGKNARKEGEGRTYCMVGEKARNKNKTFSTFGKMTKNKSEEGEVGEW